MSITFIEDKKAFLLETCHSSYQMQVSETGQLLHLYYGTPTHDLMDYLCVPFDAGFSPNPYEKKLTRGGSSDLLPLEYSGQNTGDFRTASVCSVREDGIWGADFRYEGHEILDGKYSIKGMPSAFDKSGSAESLKIQKVRSLHGGCSHGPPVMNLREPSSRSARSGRISLSRACASPGSRLSTTKAAWTPRATPTGTSAET